MADNDDADEPKQAKPSDAAASEDESDAAASDDSTDAAVADDSAERARSATADRSEESLSPEATDTAAESAQSTQSTRPSNTDSTEDASESADRPRRLNRMPSRRILASAAAAVVIVALAAVTATLVLQHRTATREQADRAAYLQAARQAVVDLTTISAGSADADVARILAASTGTFHDDFGSRSAAFTSVVKQAHVSTTGTVSAAGIESMSGDEAKVLVAATSRVTNATGADNEPRVWRLRVLLHRTQGHILVSNVDFVP
ncbi:hypothetical protein [Nocardia jiangxiensis]|uniref:hypothetical protein n=1 Tax=Nocardia jiangxiensis TaxID=282685 RepID=UPI0002F97D2D|nr:hypothetical protein [Nocardia jiangxiensis]